MRQRGKYKRGYAVALLIGLEDDRAVLWKVFSNVVKLERTILLDGTWDDRRAIYKLLESTVNALRPTLKEGVRTVILASPPSTNHREVFIDHINKHHAWLRQGPSKATFSEITGSAGTPSEVAALTRTPVFRRLISETTQHETQNLVDILEKRLNATDNHAVILYSLKEIEDLILEPARTNAPKPEYLMLTNSYLSSSKEKNRINRLMQIATNRNIKTRVIDSESTAGQRLSQLGGMVCFAQRE